jgi:hypothetical protein
VAGLPQPTASVSALRSVAAAIVATLCALTAAYAHEVRPALVICPPLGPGQPVQSATAQLPTPPSREIVLSLDQLTRFAIAFQAQWGREATPQEFARLVEDDVHQKILYREGLALGLDKGDEIVRRRMAQKIQFLAEDVAAQYAPTDAELRAWFDDNKGLFEEPLRLGALRDSLMRFRAFGLVGAT